MIRSLKRLRDLAERFESVAQKLAATLQDALGAFSTLHREITTTNQPAHIPLSFNHIGEIVRWLRKEGRLTRQQLAVQIGIADSTIRNLETGRHKATASTLSRLMRAPCMSSLPDKVKEAGLLLSLRADAVGDKKEVSE